MSGRWEPRHEAHSIEIVAAAVTFTEPLNDIQIRKALRTADTAAKSVGLVDVTALPGLRLKIQGASGVITPSDIAATNGMAFRRNVMEEDESANIVTVAADELVIDRASVAYRTRRYIRWNQFQDALSAVLPSILGGLLDSSAVQSVRLEYRDRFTYSGDATSAPTDQLLRNGSPLIAQHVFGVTLPWHSHMGMFEASDGVDRRLVQVEIGATDVDRAGTIRRSISIMTGLQDNFRLSAELEAQEQTTDMIMTRLPGLHSHSKRLFRALITESIAKEIGLGEDGV